MPRLSWRARGFTIVELIIIIIVIGIMAVSVYPLIGGRSGVDVAVYQGQVLSLLRLQQQRAMQDTASEHLYSVCVHNKEVALFKLTPSADCAEAFNQSLACEERGDCLRIDDLESTTFDGPARFNFDTMGCPYGGNTKLTSLCGGNTVTIVINGETSRDIVINEQGYIQAPN